MNGPWDDYADEADVDLPTIGSLLPWLRMSGIAASAEQARMRRGKFAGARAAPGAPQPSARASDPTARTPPGMRFTPMERMHRNPRVYVAPSQPGVPIPPRPANPAATPQARELPFTLAGRKGDPIVPPGPFRRLLPGDHAKALSFFRRFLAQQVDRPPASFDVDPASVAIDMEMIEHLPESARARQGSAKRRNQPPIE